MLKQRMEDLMQPHWGQVQRGCRSVSLGHWRCWEWRDCRTAKPSRHHWQGWKGVKIAVDQVGGSVGYTSYLDTSQGLINPGLVSVVRPEAPNEPRTQHWWCVTKSVFENWQVQEFWAKEQSLCCQAIKQTAACLPRRKFLLKPGLDCSSLLLWIQLTRFGFKKISAYRYTAQVRSAVENWTEAEKWKYISLHMCVKMCEVRWKTWELGH